MYKADLALVNANIITMDAACPRAEAALVRRGRIELVGRSAGVRAAANGSPVFDAGGRTVVPGFIDGHNHFEMTCASLVYSLPAHTPPHASLASIAGALRAEEARLAPGKWLIARSS
ncbi:MAG: amidohydrolase family protein, partial [Phycisphaerales bacterium]|nr:amidohydrolase family protein [Phycisphaerales bacterium]